MNSLRPVDPVASPGSGAMAINKPASRRYAIVGLGNRASMFTDALLGPYKDSHHLVGLCDVNQTRMDYYNREFKEKFEAPPVATYKADDFDCMVEEQQPDVIIVTTVDRVHHEYIIRAMDLGCDAITEKPMTIDVDEILLIRNAIERTGRKLAVAFNYRYAPLPSTAKRMLLEGAIGDVKAVHFEWMLRTGHGADYFRRWHRDKSNSGGLMVHKATHHFDLVNWFLNTGPQTVFGFGSLSFYGRTNAERRGMTRFYDRGTDEPNAAGDPFALDLHQDKRTEALYLHAEHEDGYRRDLSVFSEGITIEDTMNVVVRYKNGAQMSYTLTAYGNPRGGFRMSLIGTLGRMEVTTENKQILILPDWKESYSVTPPEAEGGHGGGDPRLLEDLFGVASDDPLKHAAGFNDGARSILTGIAANRSFATGLPVNVDDLLDSRGPGQTRLPC